ncbi:MAG: UbiH/UbiF/VisC/COQ6 family ubiquinone biosynthesis hydroxylase [Tatlockia sp.]|nr:UbiH/UbiF/VisC/COQ6 family ubiquinone biosynthesis hydroxylase [Tatlockia sp.]
MSQQFDVAVIGGGIVGLAAALAMVLRGFSVALIDAGSMHVKVTKSDARVYAINQASQDLLQQLGVWQHIDSSRLSPYQYMYVWDAASGAHIEFDARTIAAGLLGTIIEESILKQALLHVLSLQTGLTLFANSKVKQVESTEENIRIFSDDCSWQAQLLMIADGGNSPCRQLLKVPLTSWSYHQEAIVALVNTEKAHQQIAYQVFNADGPLAFLPMVDEKLCSIVWSTNQNHAKELMALSDENFNKELTKAFAAKLGEATVQGKRFQFPLFMRHAQQYRGSRWLLLGDAAHTIHPLAGLGLNVGLADVAAWLTCLEKGSGQLTAKKVLSSYQRQRKHAVWQTIVMMDGLKTLFGNPLSPIVAMRGLGLRLCNNFTPIKRLFIEQAIGKKAL